MILNIEYDNMPTIKITISDRTHIFTDEFSLHTHLSKYCFPHFYFYTVSAIVVYRNRIWMWSLNNEIYIVNIFQSFVCFVRVWQNSSRVFCWSLTKHEGQFSIWVINRSTPTEMGGTACNQTTRMRETLSIPCPQLITWSPGMDDPTLLKENDCPIVNDVHSPSHEKRTIIKFSKASEIVFQSPQLSIF